MRLPKPARKFTGIIIILLNTYDHLILFIEKLKKNSHFRNLTNLISELKVVC